MINPELPQRTTIMKHLLNGVAIAAVFALATPVFAQNAPMTPATPPKPAPAAPAPAPAKPAPAPKMTSTKPMHHVAHHMSQGDQMTEQLNQQELARITGGGPAPGGPAPGGPAPAPGGTAPPPPQK
jgi:translation initiation factor IF-2